jgi:hypothetical protein
VHEGRRFKVRSPLHCRKRPCLRNRRQDVPEPLHAAGGDLQVPLENGTQIAFCETNRSGFTSSFLQGRHWVVALGGLQQHISPQGELSGRLWSGTARWTDMWKRWQRLQKHLPDEVTDLRVKYLKSYKYLQNR